jgi:hypothetical protein
MKKSVFNKLAAAEPTSLEEEEEEEDLDRSCRSREYSAYDLTVEIALCLSL